MKKAFNKRFSLNPGDYNLLIKDIQMSIMNKYQATNTMISSKKAIASIPAVVKTELFLSSIEKQLMNMVWMALSANYNTY